MLKHQWGSSHVVMLALAAEEWRERRDRLELADRALRSVAEELRSNLEELELTGDRNAERREAGQAVQYFDFDLMRSLSEVYEIQDLYERMQTGAVDSMTEMMRTAEEDPVAAVRQALISLTVLTDVQGSLREVYRETLEEMALDAAT